MLWLVGLFFQTILVLLLALGAYCSLTLGVCRSTKQLKGKTVIVTGGNAGIGYETALDLAGRGARVILACRSKLKGSEAVKKIVTATGNKRVEVMVVDLASFQSVRTFASEVNNTLDKVDILVNNAGIPPPPGTRLAKDGFDLVLETNHFSAFLLTNLIKETMLRSGSPRIVNVSSAAARMNKSVRIEYDTIKEGVEYQIELVYGVSKLMNMYFTKEIARVWGPLGFQAFSLHPGVVRTEIFTKMETPPWFRSLAKPVQTALSGLLVFVSIFVSKSAKQGAQTTLHCCLEDNLPNGEYFADCRVASWYIRNGNMDDLEESSKLTGLS